MNVPALLLVAFLLIPPCISPGQPNANTKGPGALESVTLGEASPGEPVIGGDGKNLAVAWLDQPPNGDWVFYRHSSDDGRTFGPPQRMAHGSGGLRAFSADGFMHVCWENVAGTELGLDERIFYANIDLNSGRAASPLQVSHELIHEPDRRGMLLNECSVSSSGDLVLVAWQEGPAYTIHRLFGTVSVDRGKTFSIPIEIATVPGGAFTTIATSPSAAYVAWSSEADSSSRTSNLFFAALDPASKRPPEPELLSGTGSECCPDVEVSANKVLVASGGVTIRRSDDGGRTFQSPLTFEKATDSAYSHSFMWPKTVLLGSDSYSIFEGIGQDIGPCQQVYFSRVEDGAASLSQPLKLSTDTRYASRPHLFAFPRKLVAVWEETSCHLTSAETGVYVLIRVSEDRGRTFGGAIEVPVNAKDDGAFGLSSVFADSEAVFCAWQEPQVEFDEKLVRFLRIPLK